MSNQIEIGGIAEEKGLDYVCNKYKIKKETAKRYRRKYRNFIRNQNADDIVSKNTTIQKILERYSEKELKHIADGKLNVTENHKHIHNFKGNVIKFGILGDTHIGSVYTDYDYIYNAFDEFAKEGVDFIGHTGDVTEGISHRQGHMYECSEIGYDAQKEKAIEIFSQWDLTPTYMISGNHDLWAGKAVGANIVKDICNNIDNAIFMGDHEGDILLGKDKNINLRLWHGNDASSYAHSYRLQKIIESFTGGEKPHILCAGHVHKALYSYDRHVHCVSSGCIQKQSSWMRGKRLPAHTGFWIIEMVLNDHGVARFKPEFFPFYV